MGNYYNAFVASEKKYKMDKILAWKQKKNCKTNAIRKKERKEPFAKKKEEILIYQWNA